MINQERVRVMSRMAMLEAGEGNQELRVCTFYKADYILLQIIKSLIVGTVCFAAGFLLWVFWKWDDLNAFFADANFYGFLMDALILYGAFMAVYLVITGFVAAHRYKYCRKRKIKYSRLLQSMNSIYSADSKSDLDK